MMMMMINQPLSNSVERLVMHSVSEIMTTKFLASDLTFDMDPVSSFAVLPENFRETTAVNRL